VEDLETIRARGLRRTYQLMFALILLLVTIFVRWIFYFRSIGKPVGEMIDGVLFGTIVSIVIVLGVLRHSKRKGVPWMQPDVLGLHRSDRLEVTRALRGGRAVTRADLIPFLRTGAQAMQNQRWMTPFPLAGILFFNLVVVRLTSLKFGFVFLGLYVLLLGQVGATFFLARRARASLEATGREFPDS